VICKGLNTSSKKDDIGTSTSTYDYNSRSEFQMVLPVLITVVDPT